MNDEKNAARRKVFMAIASGELTRPEDCSNCNNPRGMIEAHHPDYTLPLDVVWLCKHCHVMEHSLLREKPPANLLAGWRPGLPLPAKIRRRYSL